MVHNFIIFDLDETLGHFAQLGVIHDAIVHVRKKQMTQAEFNVLCDVFIEYFRPGIFLILKYLKRKKKKLNHLKIVIYTNNNGPKSWAKKIYSYIHSKLRYKLFDQSIGAYKIFDKLIEKNRTTHDKTIKDFRSCTRAPRHSTYCFIDDQYHPDMENDNVYYIHVKPYVTVISSSIIKHKLQKLNFDLNEYNIQKILVYIQKYNFQTVHVNNQIEKAQTKKILLHIQEYIQGISKTKKKKILFNKTRKLI